MPKKGENSTFKRKIVPFDCWNCWRVLQVELELMRPGFKNGLHDHISCRGFCWSETDQKAFKLDLIGKDKSNVSRIMG